MEGNNIYIKNMVCKRCILTVSNIFQENGITPASVELGTVVLSEPIPKEKQESIRRRLEEYGFEVIDDKRMRIIEQIRIGVIEFVRHPEYQEKINLSGYLQDKCRKEYSALSKLFTAMKGISIERYYLAQKIELVKELLVYDELTVSEIADKLHYSSVLVKELLVYDELTVSEIADKLHYSSVAHLSTQFKSQTGMSPTRFKTMKGHKLKALDEI